MFRYPIIFLFLLLSLGLSAQEAEVRALKCNSNYNEFAPVSYKAGIIFCSDRPSRIGIAWIDLEGNYPTKNYYAEESKSSILTQKIVTRYNEGPACFNKDHTMMVYTGTIPGDSKKENNHLGLFFVNVSNDDWSLPTAFEYNTTDHTYNIAHPALSSDGNKLYFTSDMPGGFGGKDIYVCNRKGETWEKPVNLGVAINTSFDEVFPFISEDSKLYFSTNKNTHFDIYSSASNDAGFSMPVAMLSPINSPSDDFSFTIAADNESGYFASNRNGKNDELYQFNIRYPEFEYCPPAEEPTFCYLFEETNIIPNDSTPMIFEWEFGDGTLGSGLTTEYCYKDFGTYHVALNVYDSLTRVRFARVSEVDVTIEKSPYPFITSLEETLTNTPLKFSAAGTDMGEDKAEKYYWNFGDGTHGQGYEVGHGFKAPGYYTVQLGVQLQSIDGHPQKRCSTKIISVGTQEELALVDKNIQIERPTSSLQKDMVIVELDSTKYLQYQPDSTVYYIEFKQSEKQIHPEDPYFNNIKFEIYERFDSTETSYHYSVGNTTEMPVMMRIYHDMVNSGYITSIIKSDISHEFKNEVLKTWWYLPDSLQGAINAHINKFNDIRFDIGTYSIKPESFDNLNYIGEVMNLEQSMKLLVKAHTDSIGTNSNNLVLAEKRAEAVIQYLFNQGVNKSRLVPKGYGEESPLADNSTEEGRAINRRVEFEIIFNAGKKKK